MSNQKCLLCGELSSPTQEVRLRSELVKLWNSRGKNLCEDDLKRRGCGEKVYLFRCSGCGFQFHDPVLAGDDEFYRLLTVGVFYYSSFRPEFNYAISKAEKYALKKIIDVGCGLGDFLDLAKEKGFSVSGTNKTSSNGYG